MFQRDDHEHLFQFFNRSVQEPLKYYSSDFFNQDEYVKPEEDLDDFYQLTDIWLRLSAN